MLFNSLQFLLFLPAVVVLYFATPQRWRWALLLAASYYFYACWKLEYLVLILLSTGVDFVVARKMASEPAGSKRKRWLWASLTTNLGLLFAFKYFNFFNDSTRAVFERFDITWGLPAFDVLLPVGISFYTFQTLAYTVDVYRGRIEPERHLGRFALYVAFFPQLVAGPIERASRLLPQFREKVEFDYDRLGSGLRQITWGMFKKVVVADRLAIYVDSVYNDPTAHSGFPVIAATYFFAFQIYCDFSGYSDIAIGSARILGIDLMENFRRPYLAGSISEFWKRWHISLSTWFRDYVYIPLGGNRVERPRWFANLFVTFVVSGLWHGANWTFVIWGALHGAYLVLAIVTAPARARLVDLSFGRWSADASATWGLGVPEERGLRRVVAVFVTFHLALVAWVFFRANSVSDAFLLLESSVSGFGRDLALLWGGEILSLYQSSVVAVGVGKTEVVLSVLAIVFVQVHDMVVEFGGERLEANTPRRRLLRFAWYDLLILLILLFGAFGQQQFIYFQF